MYILGFKTVCRQSNLMSVGVFLYAVCQLGQGNKTPLGCTRVVSQSAGPHTKAS